MPKHKECEEKESVWNKWVVMSPCCPLDPLCVTMYNTVFCSRCGTIYEKMSKDSYVKSTHNTFYYTKDSYEEFDKYAKEGIVYTTEHLYLKCKGVLEKEIDRVNKRYETYTVEAARVTGEIEEKMKLAKIKKEETDKLVRLGTYKIEIPIKVEVGNGEKEKDNRGNENGLVPKEKWEEEIPF